jgi:hypothetical protein
LIAELQQLENAEAFAPWAHRALPLKNRLSAADAESVEAAFAQRLSEVEPAPGSDPKTKRPDNSPEPVRVISRPIPERDRDHLRFVAAQPCLVCGRTPSDPHHIKFAEQRAMGRKVSDRFTVPICRLHHRELHRRGDERAWWQNQGIEPLSVAATLWAKTHAAPQAETEIEREKDRSAGLDTQLNGRQFGAAAVADLRQNNETKPIRRPEAG